VAEIGLAFLRCTVIVDDQEVEEVPPDTATAVDTATALATATDVPTVIASATATASSVVASVPITVHVDFAGGGDAAYALVYAAVICAGLLLLFGVTAFWLWFPNLGGR
jgi:hypothetical protein